MCSPSIPALRERGPAYALLGGLVITLISIVVGGSLFAWFILTTRGPGAPALLPADTQFYAATTPNLGGVADVAQLRHILSADLGIPDPEALVEPVATLLGVNLPDDVAAWLSSEIAVAVRGVEATDLQTPDPGSALLRHGEVLFLFGSKNDPQAAAFLDRRRAARLERGERIGSVERNGITIHYAETDVPSPIAVFALIHHYVVFSNRLAAVEALAQAEIDADDRLARLPAFVRFRQQHTPGRTSAVYTDGTPAAEAIRAALRDLLLTELAPR